MGLSKGGLRFMELVVTFLLGT